MAQRHGEPFRGEAMTEQAIAEKALSAHATDEGAWVSPCEPRDRTAIGATRKTIRMRAYFSERL
jgi:hypothetical protein